MKSVVIGIPLAPNYHADARVISMAEQWATIKNVDTVYIASPSPEEGRDKILSVVNYMVPRPTYILFIDSDVIPRPKTLQALMKHDKDIVTGVVPICQNGSFKWNVSKDKSYKPLEIDELPTNPFKVELCGFGVVLVKTSVFDRLDWPYWRSEYKPGLRVTGEDIYFCRKAREAGFDIWCDPKVKCNHATRANFLSILRKAR